MRYGQLVNTQYGPAFFVGIEDDCADIVTAKGFYCLDTAETNRLEPITAHCIDGFFTFSSSPAIDTYGHR